MIVLVKYFWFYFVISISYEGADNFNLNLYRFSNYKMTSLNFNIANDIFNYFQYFDIKRAVFLKL